MEYKKSYIPLESDPEIFTGLMHDLGASSALQFTDIWSLEDDDLGFIPRPILALILILPPCPIYEDQGERQNVTAHDENGELAWMRQTINNACGLYGIIHSVCNIPDIIESHGHTKFLEEDDDLESCYMKAALKGHSEAPSAEAEVDHHYISLIKRSGRLYILDGDMEGPITKGNLDENEDLLGRLSRDVIREYTKSERDGMFSLLALVKSETIQ